MPSSHCAGERLAGTGSARRSPQQGGRGSAEAHAQAQRVRRDRVREGDLDVPSRLSRVGAHTRRIHSLA